MKGICFIEEMFKMVVSGQKTMTRRIIDPQPEGIINNLPYRKGNSTNDDWRDYIEIKPPYKVGDIVYLKEPYAANEHVVRYKYSATPDPLARWENKLFMPAKFARYFIKILSVKCEKLQEINVQDCYREGIYELPNNRFNMPLYLNGLRVEDNLCIMYNTPKEAFAALIDKINGKGTWESNPFVFAYEFELIKN